MPPNTELTANISVVAEGKKIKFKDKMYLCLDYLFISNTEYLIHKFYKFSSKYFLTKSFNEGDIGILVKLAWIRTEIQKIK